MDNSFIIKPFLNGKDVTEQYSVINAKIYRACNKIDKATISISFEISSKEELSSLIAKIRQIESVLDVERTTG